MESNLIYILPAFGVVGLLYMLFLSSWVNKQPAGNEKMTKLSGYIASGALAFLKAEYKMLAVFVLIAGAALGALSATNLIPAGMFIVVSFVIGAVFSALAGNIGMRIATKANVRTEELLQYLKVWLQDFSKGKSLTTSPRLKDTFFKHGT